MRSALQTSAPWMTLFTVLLVGLSSTVPAAGKEDGKAILEGIQKYSNCIVQSTFSFLVASSSPPKSEAELKSLCSSQAEGFKCVKERTKGSLPLLRRGLVSYVTGRAKHHKKYCTNTASEQSRKFVEATKCIMEKRYQAYRDMDGYLVQTLTEIARRNYTDSAAELKRICCAFHTYRASYSDNAGNECSQHKPMIEELAGTIVSDDINLICEDDEKLAKVCPTLEPLPFKRVRNFTPDVRVPSAALALYLVTTLGEPNHPEFTL